MYSLIRSLIGPNEARIEIQDSVVVRTTRTSARPSTPSLNWIPKAGIHGAETTNWNDPPRFGIEPDEEQERHDPGREGGREREHPGVAGRRRRDDDRADQRQERHDRQDRERVERHVSGPPGRGTSRP